jgi:hypothetical protein
MANQHGVRHAKCNHHFVHISAVRLTEHASAVPPWRPVADQRSWPL